ncbi:hypothetical protein AB4Z46_24855 [Variovorax sp. M-6]|uniref:hypothetical protein n=1 Tax=Variovorax sp. M-6 TaxID=3233041 RepID=UPI003F9B79FF
MAKKSDNAAKAELPAGGTPEVLPRPDFHFPGEIGRTYLDSDPAHMSANNRKIAEGRLERTIPIQISLGEGLDVGMDIGSPIDFTYKLPFAFTGTIERVTVELGQLAVAAAKPGRARQPPKGQA